MKKLALFTAAFAALLPVAAGSAAPRGAGPGKPTVTMHFLEIQTTSNGTVTGNGRPTFGDRFSFHSEFYKWNGTKRGAHLGHADVSALFLSSNALQITGVASLPGGTVTVVGDAGQQRNTTLPIVGGTGVYANARGEVVIHSLGAPSSNKSADVVRIWT